MRISFDNLYAYFLEHHGWRVLRVVAVGAVGFLIQSAVFEVLGIQLALVAASTAAVIGGECAILSNFALNNRFSFSDAARSVPIFKRLIRFHIVSSGSLLTQWLFVFIAESSTDDDLILRFAFIAGVGIGFLINYTGYYFFVWRKEAPAEPEIR